MLSKKMKIAISVAIQSTQILLAGTVLSTVIWIFLKSRNELKTLTTELIEKTENAALISQNTKNTIIFIESHIPQTVFLWIMAICFFIMIGSAKQIANIIKTLS